ncbi:helix-turn-helix domain-containing protein [Thalassotalea psychrophila]|uniref:Helix-turn-helix domain-containing protein n=1 Tax=Thalassotalea psychrophila TaxID=3065647 RepID=A0ABY9TZD6_9GAMM|nr:helix-turn-helix domain-containing protein [Colwelliaceae bacterium SQ149]
MYTTAYNNIKLVQRALKRIDFDLNKMLSEYKFDFTPYNSGMDRVPCSLAHEFYLKVLQSIHCPNFPFEISKEINPSALESLGVSLLFSESLTAFIQRLEKFSLISSDNSSFQFEQELKRLTFTIFQVKNPTVEAFLQITSVVALDKLIKLAYKSDFSFAKIQLQGNVLSEHRSLYLDYFQCDIEFDAEQTRVYFQQEDLSSGFMLSNELIAHEQDLKSLELVSLLNQGDLISQIKLLITKLLPTGECSREKISSLLNMSSRLVHRRLEKLGITYKQVLEDVRKEQACIYLKQNKSINEISYLLGYTDASNFTRSFRGWYGVPPKEYKS